VVLLDFLGIFGDSDSEGDSGDAHADLDGGMDFDGGHGDLDGGDGGDHAGDATAGQLGSGHTVLSVLSYLRLFVYFCLGFGPTGWASLASGRSVGSSLLLATGVGVVAVFIAQAFFRFQRSSTDSSVGGDDLLAQRATVTIPLSHSDMGRVRVQLGMSVAEPYALAAREGENFVKGDTVRIVKVADDCVYVE
jgi:membrane protein implicated in regulation of membrane protease activity